MLFLRVEPSRACSKAQNLILRRSKEINNTSTARIVNQVITRLMAQLFDISAALASLAIPDVGPMVAGGLGALTSLGFSEDEAR